MDYRSGIMLIGETRIRRLDNLTVAVKSPGIARAVAARAGQDYGDASPRIP